MKPVWSIETESPGLGGIAATRDFVIYSARGLRDTSDLFRCVRASDGSSVWSHSYPALGALDYGNSPRATPLIQNGRVYVQGAMGHLACLDLKSGEPVWELSLKDEFDIKEDLKWGFCASPLIVEGNLIAFPGAPEASIIGLDPDKGKILWKTAGKPPGYGSPIEARMGGKSQIVAYDADSLGGWDPGSGKRLWRFIPQTPNDFNVPTPIVLEDGLLVCTENNGTRNLGFGADGTIKTQPRASFRKLAPDTHTPVRAGEFLLGVSKRLYCLEIDSLKPVWESADPVFGRYCAIVASASRALVISLDGELLLFGIQGETGKPLDKALIFPGEKGLYSHPAFVGRHMYIRGSSSLACFDLKE